MFLSSFLIVFVVLFVAWVVGFAFHLLGGLIHLLLFVALITGSVLIADCAVTPSRTVGSSGLASAG